MNNYRNSKTTGFRKPLPDLQYLDRRFRYCSETGTLFFKNDKSQSPSWNGKNAGNPAGTISDRGYLVVKMMGSNWPVHRLIWKMLNLKDPDGDIDHIDGNRLNNRPGNLRTATASQNAANSRKRSSETSSVYKGVSRVNGRWQAYINYRGRQRYIRSFSDEVEAAKAYDHAAAQLHGEYASLNFPSPSKF